MPIALTAAAVCTLLTLGVALFQFTLALGASLGRYAWGGRFPATHPPAARVASAVAGMVLLLVAGLYAGIVGLLPPLVGPAGRLLSIRVLTGLFALSTVGNLASRSRHERLVFTPITAMLLFANGVLLTFDGDAAW